MAYGSGKKRKRRGVTKGGSGYRPFRESGGTRRPSAGPPPVFRAQPRSQITPPAAPTAGAVNTATSQAAAASYSGGEGAYNVGSDPAVAAAQGLAAKIRTQAQASALAKRKQAAIEYGDPTGVEGVDEATAKASRENPFSVLKNLEHANTTGTRDLEEGLNSANLFYSGYRGQQLGEAARGYQNSKYQAATAFKGLNTDINDQLAQALLNADYMEQGAIMGSDGGYYDSGGGDSGGYDPSRPAGGYLKAIMAGRDRTPGYVTGKPTKAPVTRFASPFRAGRPRKRYRGNQNPWRGN